MRWWQWLASAFVVLCLWGAYRNESTKKDRYADHVLRRCEEDTEFRERLRKALGVKP